LKRINPVLLTLSLLIAPAVVHADTWDKKTTVNFSQPVEVPGYVLQPGKYVMKLVNLSADRHVVQFTNERENHVYATASAVPAYRNEVSDKTVITFYEVPAGQPEAMKNWYYPGDNFGQEFVYPQGHFSQVAAVTRQTNLTAAPEVAAGPTAPPPAANVVAPVPSDAAPVSSEAAPVEIAQATPPASPQTEAAPASAPAPPPAGLPETASKLPEIALLGFLFVGGALTARSLRRS
jgi:hypothetical protein